MARELLNQIIEVTIIVVLHATHLSSYHHESKTLCVYAADKANECSNLTLMFNCSECQPLSFYIQNVSKYFNSNIETVFTTGDHCLSPPPGSSVVVNLTEISNFTMKGLGNVSYNVSEEGATQPSSVITCGCSQNKSAILFYKSNAIHIERLTIEDCGTKVVLPNPPKTNFITVSALILYESYLSLIHI